MSRPNLFSFATSELSQDAFICWLASWADPAYQSEDKELHATARAFLDRLLEVGGVAWPETYRSVKVERQWENIDVLLTVNDDTAIIIEDKIDTKDHSDQLERYEKSVRGRFPNYHIASVYLKTGDQSSYHSAEDAGYGCFLRRDLLDILDRGERVGVKNAVFADFHSYLRNLEEVVQSYSSVSLSEWNKDWNRWKGFFGALQNRLGEGDWSYVANPSGGFMGFWWHWRDGKYLQLENDKLCFKIKVPEKSEQAAKWIEWHKSLMAKDGSNGIRIRKPVRRAGKWMTVAVLNYDYRQANEKGVLDFDKTVTVLKKAEAFMDAAIGPVMIRFTCPQCKKLLQAAQSQVGVTVACPECKTQMAVPSTALPTNWQ